MNIVHVSGGELRIPVQTGGGHEGYILGIAKCLAEKGHEVTVLDRKYSRDDPDVEYEDSVRLVRLSARRFPGPNQTARLALNQVSFANDVRRYLGRNRADIVHAHVSITGLALALLRPGLRSRLFYTSHATRRGKTSQSHLDRVVIAMENQLVRRVRLSVALTTDIRDKFLTQTGVSPESVAVLPMGTDTERFSPSVPIGDVRRKYGLNGGVTVLFVGRIRADKGLEYLIGAAREVVSARRHGNVRFLLVGPIDEFFSGNGRPSPYMAHLQRMVREYGLEGNVRFTGAVEFDDLRSLYAACTVFVLPSVTEAAPQAVVEAMSSGKPVIATRVGAVPTQIADGQDGFLVDPADEQQLAERLRYVLENPDRATTVGEAARRRAEAEFSWASVTEALLRCYETAV